MGAHCLVILYKIDKFVTFVGHSVVFHDSCSQERLPC